MSPTRAGTAYSVIRLQTRLVLLVLLICGAALLTVGAVLPVALDRWLLQDKDSQLTQAADQMRNRQLPKVPAGSVQSPIGVVLFNPVDEHTEILAPAGTDPDAYPRLPENFSTGPVTLPANSDHPRLRAVGFALPYGSIGYVWTPLADVSATVTRVALLEIAASASILTGLGLLSHRLLRRQLSPLLEITATARKNSAAGTRHRAAATMAAPEVIDLRDAFNSMLDTVDASTAAQAGTETKLRRFVTDASHELRTPLAAILGYGEMYQRGMITEPAAVRRAVDTILVEADRMRDLVNALMSLDGQQQPPPSALREINLGDLAQRSAWERMDRSPHHRIEVEADQGAIIIGDPTRLGQALNAILDNVEEHAPAAVLTVINVDRTDRAIRLTVDDDGPGVPPEALPLLFDRFYRTDASRNRSTGGAGLGLAIISAITAAHRGNATAGASPLGGLRIQLTFPPRAWSEHSQAGSTPSAGDSGHRRL